MANISNLNLSDVNEISVYNTPDTTLVLENTTTEDISNDNINISLINAEQGFGDSSYGKNDNFKTSAASSIGEQSPAFNVSSTSSARSTHSKRKREDSPDSYSIVNEEDLLSDTTDLSSDMDIAASGKSSPADSASHTKKTHTSIEIPEDTDNTPSSTNDKGSKVPDGAAAAAADVGLWYDEYSGQHFPGTVAVMKAPDGALVYLVGTVHFSAESHDDVSKVVQAVQPHIVLIELCDSRMSYLEQDEKTMLEEAKNLNFSTIRQIIATNGLASGLLFVLLLSSSAHVAEQIGTAPGLEFRRALTEARKVPGCIVQLGDRPLTTTVRRAIAALSWWELIKLMFELIMDKNSITKEEIEKLKNHGMLDELLAEMAEKCPAVRHVFVDERDTYMAHSLQLAAIQHQVDENGKPVPCRVVGVVGIGHMKGIIAKLGKVSSADVIPISQVPDPSLVTRMLSFTISASFWGLLFYGVSRVGFVRRAGSAVAGAVTSTATTYLRR